MEISKHLYMCFTIENHVRQKRPKQARPRIPPKVGKPEVCRAPNLPPALVFVFVGEFDDSELHPPSGSTIKKVSEMAVTVD